MHTTDDGNRLQAHTGTYVNNVLSWLLDDSGHLYASTNLGPGLVAGRDLMQVLDTLSQPDGVPADLDQLVSQPQSLSTLNVLSPFQSAGTTGIPLQVCPTDQVETIMGFVRNPALGYA